MFAMRTSRPNRYLLITLVAVSAACTKHNPLVCCVGADDCSAIGASAPEACPNGLTCVLNECQVPPDAAIDATNGPDSARLCVSHADCGSPGACLPDGSCGTDANVAWVAQTGDDTTMCTKAMPCATLTHALAQNKPYIKVATGTIHDQPTIKQNVTILADAGAQVVGVSVGPMVTITGTSIVTIYDLTIAQGPGSTGFGILVNSNDTPTVTLERASINGNHGRGIAMMGGALTVSRSTIFNNFDGGIYLQNNVSTFDITNTFITHNGNVVSGDGAVLLTATNGAGSRFAFNTIVDNNRPGSSVFAGGVTCDMGNFTAPNNIIARNYVNNDANVSNANHAGACTYPTSAIQTSVTNLDFVAADALPYDYHLTAGSLAIDQATTAMAVDVDVDGDTRPQGAQKDQGADEYK